MDLGRNLIPMVMLPILRDLYQVAASIVKKPLELPRLLRPFAEIIGAGHLGPESLGTLPCSPQKPRPTF